MKNLNYRGSDSLNVYLWSQFHSIVAVPELIDELMFGSPASWAMKHSGLDISMDIFGIIEN